MKNKCISVCIHILSTNIIHICIFLVSIMQLRPDSRQLSAIPAAGLALAWLAGKSWLRLKLIRCFWEGGGGGGGLS